MNSGLAILRELRPTAENYTTTMVSRGKRKSQSGTRTSRAKCFMAWQLSFHYYARQKEMLLAENLLLHLKDYSNLMRNSQLILCTY